MSLSDRPLFCCLDGLTPIIREERRIAAIKLLDLLNTTSVPILEEATQMVASFLDSPICVITLMVDQEVLIKATFGLLSLGLMNSLATSRTIKREDSFCTYVVDSQQPFCIEDTLTHSVLSQGILAQKYQIRSYLGVPLVTQAHHCIGTLAIMNLQPFSYDQKSLEYLELVSRWCLREIELNYCQKILSFASSGTNSNKQLQVLHQFGEELRNPLTSIVGMTSVLAQGVLGILTNRQQEYLKIIYSSSQYLKVLLDELLNLTSLPIQNQQTKLSLVNLEMLSQKVIQGLTPIASRKLQTLLCSSESPDVVFPLDRDKIYQALCYLLFYSINLSPSESIITIHLSSVGENAVIYVDFPAPQCLGVSSKRENNSLDRVKNQPNSSPGLELSYSLIQANGGTLNQETLLENAGVTYNRYIISLPKIQNIAGGSRWQ